MPVLSGSQAKPLIMLLSRVTCPRFTCSGRRNKCVEPDTVAALERQSIYRSNTPWIR